MRVIRVFQSDCVSFDEIDGAGVSNGFIMGSTGAFGTFGCVGAELGAGVGFLGATNAFAALGFKKLYKTILYTIAGYA